MITLAKQMETDGAASAKRILLAEDSPGDVLLLQLAFKSLELPFVIETVVDGDRLISRLRELAETQNQEVGLAVVDGNLPRRNAEEVLLALGRERIRLEIPMVVLSSYVSEARERRFKQLGATKILTKPMDFDGFLHLAREVATLCESANAATA